MRLVVRMDEVDVNPGVFQPSHRLSDQATPLLRSRLTGKQNQPPILWQPQPIARFFARQRSKALQVDAAGQHHSG
jgi:hypothetical protein